MPKITRKGLKAKKPSKATMRRNLNALLHAYCRIRDGDYCQKCGSTQVLQLSHVYPKGKYTRMEFVADNVKLLCYKCHIHWWHKNPIEAGEWFTKKFPDRAKRLKLMSQNTNLPPFNYLFHKTELEELLK